MKIVFGLAGLSADELHGDRPRLARPRHQGRRERHQLRVALERRHVPPPRRPHGARGSAGSGADARRRRGSQARPPGDQARLGRLGQAARRPARARQDGRRRARGDAGRHRGRHAGGAGGEGGARDDTVERADQGSCVAPRWSYARARTCSSTPTRLPLDPLAPGSPRPRIRSAPRVRPHCSLAR